MIEHRLITDDPIPVARAQRRRVRLLVERGTRIETKEVRELAKSWAAAVEEKHGHQDGIAIMFYDDILSTTGILGSWDRCPGARWANAVDAPDLPQMWVITIGADADMLLKIKQYLQEQARRRHSSGGGNVDKR